MERNLLRWVRQAGIELESHLNDLQNGLDDQVNGNPVGKLPYSITAHAEFQRIFDGTVFEVRDATGSSDYPGSLSTVQKFNNCSYNFFMANKTLLVTEIHDDGSKFQLISQSHFEGDIPSLLIHNFSHWRNLSTNIIHFRPINFLDPNWTSKPEYSLSLDTKELIHTKTERKIVDIKKKTFLDISLVMERLEHRNQILVFVDGQNLVAELPRMALHFIVNKTGVIESKEYSGMCVDKIQQLETLIGLRSGLLLRSTDFEVEENMMAPMLLVPNGQVLLSSSGNVHHEVRIATESLDVPEYFAFEVDTRLKRLRAGQSRLGWLYLVYLHAVTASPMPDPFLEMTGTEAALQLLQSPLCWSCEPLERTALYFLKRIGNLSPERAYYPHYLRVMERNNYPEYPSSVAAQDSFQIIVQKIVDDSQRLKFLFPDSVSTTENDPSTRFNPKLCIRAYWRHAKISNEHCRINNSKFFKVSPESKGKLLSSAMTHLQNVNLTDIRTLAQLCSTWTSMRMRTTESSILTALLCDQEKLELKRQATATDSSELLQKKESEFFTQAELIKQEFPSSWFNLYEIARVVEERSWECQWTILLCQLACGNNSIPLDHLVLLHTIAVNPEVFKTMELPPYDIYFNTKKYDFDIAEASKAIQAGQIGFKTYYSRDKSLFKNEMLLEPEERKRYKLDTELKYYCLVVEEALQLARIVSPKWPTNSCNSIELSYDGLIDIVKAKSKLNLNLANWFENLQLHNFLVEIQKLIQKVDNHSSVETVSIRHHLSSFDEFQKHHSSFRSANSDDSTKKLLGYELNGLILTNHTFKDQRLAELARNVFETGQSSIDLASHLDKFHSSTSSESTHKANADRLFSCVNKALLDSTDTLPYRSMLSAAGLFPRLTPTTLMPKLLSDNIENSRIHDLLGAVAVLWTLDQKEIRCVKLQHAGLMEFALKKEYENEGHKFWSPKERPGWLLLELDMDIMIREIQVEVAERMLHPLDDKNSLMQLNMGEGKTSVILPLLIASLANGRQLARVTLLKSLFNTNTEVLRLNLGGLLRRRLYTFPCRRNMAICAEKAQTMLGVYQECVKKRGFVLTLPEHRLSFQLAIYERSRWSCKDSMELLNVQEWLYNNARDILDESDQILDVKYQLIYSVGGQIPVDGGSLRWTVLQSVLKLLPKHLVSIITTGTGISDLAECRYTNHQLGNGAEIFPRCRIFKRQCYEKLCKSLFADILEGNSEIKFRELNSASQGPVTVFVTKACVTPEIHAEVMALFGSDTTSTVHLDTLLILRGMLAGGNLLLGLTKRWRVNYGTIPKAKEFSRRMAVPYRAKDVASEQTEFGHPDVAILLTQLSYYYSGLSDSQLKECFARLERHPNPELVYNSWICKMRIVDPSISSFSRVHLDDFEQRTKILFPSLRKNIFVIDFWLNNVVYPRETKVFGHKLMCSPWDLTSDIAKHPVTGFSGTNDTAVLLPLQISQKDLPNLMDTNEKVRSYILGRENNNYESLPTAFSGLDVLKLMVEMRISLLLDVGALILELTNVQVAEEWLKLIPDTEKFEAAVYFDSMDRLMVKDRLGRESKLELSPYKTRLDHCVIYLDDVHTRGTDLKMPSGTKGCVTLGKGVTRDKLVQGCMRMRLLGNGHSIQFLASQEVHNEIDEMHTEYHRAKANWNEKVINWCSRNTDISIKEGFIHWVNAGLNYLRKEAARFLYNSQKKLDISTYRQLDPFSKVDMDLAQECDLLILTYGDRCSDTEATSLMEMYGEFRAEDIFYKIAAARLNHQEEIFLEKLSPTETQDFVAQIVTKFRSGRDDIVAKCEEHIPEVKKLASLTAEDQEREYEQEEERQSIRPQRKTVLPCKPQLDEDLRKFIVEGTLKNGKLNCLMELPEVYKTTSLWPVTQAECWGKRTYATRDFVRTIQTYSRQDYVDQFLRPATWIISFKWPPRSPAGLRDKTTNLMFVSPFEANALMPVFRWGKSISKKLHMFAPRVLPKQDTLLLSPELWIPSTIPSAQRNPMKYFNDFHQLHSILLLFSGSQFFENEEEQTAYCKLTGYIPRQRTIAEQKVYDEDGTVNGFVKPHYRKHLKPSIITSCQFQVNPQKLILGIIQQRYEQYFSKCHVRGAVVDSLKENFEIE